LGVCAEAEDEDQALRALEVHKPNLVTVDITLKRSNGLDLVKALHEKFADLPVVVVSMHEEEVYGERGAARRSAWLHHEGPASGRDHRRLPSGLEW
jgi:DNA-binding NarL/FixJ family response regulator